MKTTVDLPDELLVAAKKRAAETRSTLRALIESGLRHELSGPPGRRSGIRWVTVDGGLPPGVDPGDRASMSDWIRRGPVADRDELARRALALAGRYRSGCRDLAEEHDRHLDEAFDS